MAKIKRTFSQIRRSPYQAIAAITLTSLTFFILSIFTLVVLGAGRLLTYFESRPQVTAFFKDETTRDSAMALENKIKSSLAVDSVKYISKADALAIYQEQNQSDPLLLEMVTADILPSSLEVSAKNVSDLGGIAEIMKQDKGVEEVVFQKDVVDTLKSWVDGIRLGGTILSLVLIFVSLATIIIILGLKFTAKKAEINTLSLLGATSWYIRRPFVIEGVFYTIIGAIIGWAFAYTCLLYLTPNLINFFRDIAIFPVPYWVMVSLLGGELVLGTALGSVASLIATRRYGK